MYSPLNQIYISLMLAVVLGFSVLDCYAEVKFEEDVAMILAKRCVECHNSKDPKGGLDLSSKNGMLQGGDAGQAVIAGDAEGSYLLDRIQSGEMPPPSRGESQKLPAVEINSLMQWISGGAKWPDGRVLDIYERTTDVRGGRDWWSFQPINKSPLPISTDHEWVTNPVDAFILHQLNNSGMQPAEPASRQALLRRIYFDLIGLPPSIEDFDAFVNSKDESAYEQVVDTLLASPQFGERWARHWLDLIRFAETCGYERDQLKPNIWKYRDWVVNAFNKDLPYNQFVTDQLAGDEVPYKDEQTMIATGMIRAGTWNDEPNDPQDYQYTRLEDMVHTTSSAFIGLTVKCARCHNHKFDPIRQTDYYRYANAFWSGYIGQSDLGGPPKDKIGETVFAWTDRSKDVAPLYRLINGERTKPAELIQPASISTIPGLERTFEAAPQDAATTHQRLQLARWITNPEHPLTSRVIVNRLWQYTMGEGLVRTPNNFGFKGDLATHPELLDWLARDLMDGDWKMKRVIKLIVMSNTYQQASVHRFQNEYAQKDFLNHLWWRSNRKRLDAEQLRDSILATSGQLNPKMGGPSFFPLMSNEALEGLSRKNGAWGASSLSERNRRSIYMMTKRSRLLPLMTTFNFTDTTLPCGQRDSTTVAPQALALLNNQFVHQNSRAFASRVAAEFPDSLEMQINHAWRIAVGRRPTSEEFDASSSHVLEQRVQFGSNTNPSALKLDKLTVTTGLSLWLDATQRLDVDEEGRVRIWGDSSGSSKDGQFPIDAAQGEPTTRPFFVANAISDKPAIRFNGKNQLLKLTATPIAKPNFTIIAVASDKSALTGHREIISNWNNRGKSVSSVFLGTTAQGKVRFSDAMKPQKALSDPATPFILTSINGVNSASVFQNGAKLAESKPLPKRDISGPYVIGTQGNYGSEYWQGDIAEILVYDREVSQPELDQIWGYLATKYGIQLQTDKSTPDRLALESLCHVLLNLNEFIYVD